MMKSYKVSLAVVLASMLSLLSMTSVFSQSLSESESLSARDFLYHVAPSFLEALEKVEKERGIKFTDDEIRDVLKSGDLDKAVLSKLRDLQH